jgi:cobalt-zinc-cadmium efflux system protein
MNSNQDHHDHLHQHTPSVPLRMNLSFAVAVIANLLFTLVETILAFEANSTSLLGDAGHNFSDVLGLLLAWGATYLVGRTSGSDYSYGYRRTTILAALLNSMILLFAGGFIALQSIERLYNPVATSEMLIIVVALVGIFVNGGTALLFMKSSQNDLNVKGAFLHLAYDALISAGVVVGGVVILFTGWLWVDPLMGLLITVVIVYGTWALLRDSVNLILDAVPQGIDRTGIVAYLSELPGVAQVHDVHIWAMSTQENCLTAHLVMPDHTLWDQEDGYSQVGSMLRDNFAIHHVTLQVEKDPDCQTQDCDEEG